MSIRSATLGLALLAVMVLPAFAEDAPATAPQELQWTEFQSPERGFSVSFPGTPKTTTSSVEGQNPLIQYDFEVSVGDDTVYSVVVFEYPAGKGPNPDADAFIKLVNAYAKGSESRLRKRGIATIDGRSGFEAIADDNKSKLSHLIDVVPAGDRVYMLVTAGPKSVNAYAKGSESRLRKRGTATIDGRSGFEAIADDNKSKLSHLIDVVPAGDRVYMLVSAGPKSHATSDDAERFRDSFHVLDGGASAAPAQSAANPPAQ